MDDARRWCRALTAGPARAAVAETLDECLDGGGGASVLVDALLVLAVAQHLAGRPDAGDAALSLRTELDPGADATDSHRTRPTTTSRPVSRPGAISPMP